MNTGCNKENCVSWGVLKLLFLLILLLLFVHFVVWANVPASGGGLFRHLLHLTLLATVVIFWLNDAWKWKSIFCDQKRYVMAVRYMHYKQPGCLWKWEYHKGLCTSERAMHFFKLSFIGMTWTYFETPVSSVFLCQIYQLHPTNTNAFPWKETWMYHGSNFKDPHI